MVKEIARASIKVLAKEGMDDWSIAAAAREAGCAKGLVHYYFRSRSELLAEMARTIVADRHDRKLRSLKAGGAAAIDGLWDNLRAEVSEGAYGAWLGLSALNDATVRTALRPPESAQTELGRAAASALGIGVDPLELGAIVEAALTGFQMILLQNIETPALEEAHHRFWLSLLD
ncbi:MAG: TetR family transcriptional regulator [Gemmatimonadota bacterium]